MNKKKKTTRIKHRKNRDRIRKLLQTSLLKAKSKKAVQTPIDKTVPETEVKTVEKVTPKKPVTKKPSLISCFLSIANNASQSPPTVKTTAYIGATTKAPDKNKLINDFSDASAPAA